MSNLAFAQSSKTTYQINKEKANRGTVTVISYFLGTYAAFGADLANVLNGQDGVRVLPVMGHGTKQNIEDVLYLKGIDIGFVMANVLNHIAKNKKDVDLKKRLAYITTLYPEEIHLITREEVNSITELKGKKVNFGPSNSGTRITSKMIFDRLKLDVQEVNYDENKALEALINGKISAMIYSDGKPTDVVASIAPNAGIKLLDIPYESVNTDGSFKPANFSHEDYPKIIPDGESVKTIAVPNIMIVYNWGKNTKRYQKVKNFVEVFYRNFHKFQEGGRHKKWKEVVLSDTLPGWNRFPPAEVILKSTSSLATVKPIVSKAECLKHLEDFEIKYNSKFSETEKKKRCGSL